MKSRAESRIPQKDARREALAQVFVRADDDHRTILGKAGRQGGDAVVGLAAFGDLQGQSQSPHQAFDGVDLADEVFRRRIAVGLVQREQLVAEVFAPAVEHEDEVPGLLFPQDAQQHARNYQQCVGGKAVRALHAPVGIKTPVDEGRAVHEKNGLFGQAQALFQRHGVHRVRGLRGDRKES